MKQVSYFGYFDPALRRNILLTSARPPLGVTVSTTDVVVFTKVTMSARKYGSYEPCDSGLGCPLQWVGFYHSTCICSGVQ